MSEGEAIRSDGRVNSHREQEQIPAGNADFDYGRKAFVISQKVDTTQYRNLLTQWGFNVDDSEKNLDSFLSDQSSGRVGSVQQILIAIFCSQKDPRSLKDVLTSLNTKLSERVDQVLLFCRICDDSELLKKLGNSNREAFGTDCEIKLFNECNLARSFSASKFQFRKTITAYALNSSQNIENFLNCLMEKQKQEWRTECIHSILDELEIDGLWVGKRPIHKRPFRQDIYYLSTLKSLANIEAINEYRNDLHEKLCQQSKAIYSNRRSKSNNLESSVKNPRVLIILNFNKISEESSQIACQLHADLDYLSQLFCALEYDVRSVQTDAGTLTTVDVEDQAREFTKDTDHGDSCVLIVLSESKLASKTNIYDLMAKGVQVIGKPRLLIIQEAVTRRSNNHEVDANRVQMAGLPGTELLAYKDKRVHPHSGMLFCQSTTTASDQQGSHGSPFVRALCETFVKYAREEDVVSMISRIHAHQMMKSVPDEHFPRWCIQTSKMFFITDTSKAETASQGISPLEIEELRGGTASEKDSADGTGVAVILTDELYDEVRNYQMFLELAGFEVQAEMNDGTMKGIIKMLNTAVQRESEVLNVILIVRKYCAIENALPAILNELKSSGGEATSLLIYLEIHDGNEEVGQLDFDKVGLPNKLSVAYHRGTMEQVTRIVDEFVKVPQDDLEKSLIVGFDFAEQSLTSQVGLAFEASKENRPLWRSKLRRLPLYSSLSEGAFTELVSAMPNRVKSTSAKFADLKKRALVIHNVNFQSQSENCARYGSLYDCQRLIDSFTNLGYRVSVRSNLTANKLENEVAKFADAEDHQGGSCIMAVMSHGSMGQVSGTDQPIAEARILELMSKYGKQKLVIFQSCRDSGEDDASVVHPCYSDMIVAHSTSPSFLSFQEKMIGSRFIRSLCLILDVFAKDLDVLSLSTYVNYIMMNCFPDSYSQLPCWLVNTKNRFWLGDNAPAQGLNDVLLRRLLDYAKKFSK